MEFKELRNQMIGKHYILRQKFSNGSDYILVVKIKDVKWEQSKDELFGYSVAETEIVNVEVQNTNDSNFYIDVNYANNNHFHIHDVKNYFVENGYSETTAEVWDNFYNKALELKKEGEKFLEY